MKRILLGLALLMAAGSAHADVPCLPKVALTWGSGSCSKIPAAVNCGDVPASVASTSTKWAVYVCTTAAGYVTVQALFNPSDIADYVIPYTQSLFGVDQANALCQTKCTPFTAAEQAFVDSLVAANRPIAVVAFNSGNPRNVYTTNADGTLNPTPVPGLQIKEAARCNDAKRIVTANNYYDVAGAANAVGGVLPANSYAVCVVSFPIGVN